MTRALILTILLCPTIAYAAEAILPIKVRIIRCVTKEERKEMCKKEKLCCQLPRDSHEAEK